jgi:hypothetical protein
MNHLANHNAAPVPTMTLTTTVLDTIPNTHSAAGCMGLSGLQQLIATDEDEAPFKQLSDAPLQS